jgi:hypothetical protein
MIYGALYVQAGIDPTYLALEPQPTIPVPTGLYGIWVNNSNQLQYNGDITLINSTFTSSTLTDSSLNISVSGNTVLLNSNNLTFTSLSSATATISNQGNIGITTTGQLQIGNPTGIGNQNYIQIDDTNIIAKSTNGFNLFNSTIQYPSEFWGSGPQALATTSSYAQTFNITSGTATATLPLVDSTNVGIQFLITNTTAGPLSVAASGSQTIYSSTGVPSLTPRSLPTGHSQIFTAIRTTANNVYGWSMV